MILRAAREEMLEKGWKPDMIMYSLWMNKLFQGKKIHSNLRTFPKNKELIRVPQSSFQICASEIRISAS
jgi:hypothetical protein